MKKKKSSKSMEINIRQKNRKVIAVLTDNGKYVKHAVAKCHPDDVFDFEIGAKLAFKRLLGLNYAIPEIDESLTEAKPYRIVKQDQYEVGDKVLVRSDLKPGFEYGTDTFTDTMTAWLGKEVVIRDVNTDGKYHIVGGGIWHWTPEMFEGKIVKGIPEKVAVKEVRRPAKEGEWIKLTSKSFDFNKVGDILPVCKSYDSYVCVYDKDQPKGRKEPDDDPFYEWAYGSDEYVVLENYQPEQSSLESKANYTTEIQIGDTVKVVNNGKCYTRYEEWFVKNAPQYLGKFAYGGMPKNGGSYKVLMKNDKDGLKYVIQEIDWPNDAVYLIDEKGIEKVK